MALVLESLSCFAARSETGAISSPKTSVATANRMPMRNRVLTARQGASPELRITVYSELAARRDSAYSVPISTTTGNSSYTWLGTVSATKASACCNRYPPLPRSVSSLIRSKKAKRLRNAAKTNSVAPYISLAMYVRKVSTSAPSEQGTHPKPSIEQQCEHAQHS